MKAITEYKKDFLRADIRVSYTEITTPSEDLTTSTRKVVDRIELYLNGNYIDITNQCKKNIQDLFEM